MTEKIQSSHIKRTAYVYVRQSSMQQVRNNQESRKRQYGLQARAQELGFSSVSVIDEDLGISGSGSRERPGFSRLLQAVCEGKVGAVFAVEASRLARNNRDWHHLIDLCVLTDTLVIDHDGTYDPKLMNDRLLLGLKGSMSEFELSLLRQRAQEAFKQKVRRGEVLTEVPVGYVRTENNQVEKIADMQVQEAIAGVFSLFRKLGSARQVLLWYRQEQIPLCAHERGHEVVVWRLPGYKRIIAILKNPIYAGAFVYGRTCTRTQMVDGRARKTSGHRVLQEDWEVLIHDHHPAYISWDEYMKNQEQLSSNLPKYHGVSAGAPKRGPGLLAGLLRCGRCGRKLHVSYSGNGGRVPRYHCRGAHINHGTGLCISMGGLRVDRAVSHAVIEALVPAGVEASLASWEQACQGDEQKQRSLELAVEKAQYEVERARRQYNAVDPEHRLVATELERRWNEALEHQAEMEKRLHAAQIPELALSEEDRKRLLELGSDLERLWNHPNACSSIKKQLVRTVLEEIVVDLEEERNEIVLQLHWAGGVHTRLVVLKNRIGRHGRCTDRGVVELVRELAKVCEDASIANVLNRLGYRTGADNTWTEVRVRSLRSYQKIQAYDRSDQRAWITMQEAAAELAISASTARRMISQGIIPAKQVVKYAPWVIEREDLDHVEVKSAVKAAEKERKAPRTDRGQNLMPFISTT